MKPPFVRTSMCKGFPIEITIYQKTIYIYVLPPFANEPMFSHKTRQRLWHEHIAIGRSTTHQQLLGSHGAIWKWTDSIGKTWKIDGKHQKTMDNHGLKENLRAKWKGLENLLESMVFTPNIAKQTAHTNSANLEHNLNEQAKWVPSEIQNIAWLQVMTHPMKGWEWIGMGVQ